VHFGNHFAKAGTSRKKSDICLDIGADVLIDDNPKYAYDCAIHGCQVLLFNWKMGYPWSNLPDECVVTHPNHSDNLASQSIRKGASCFYGDSALTWLSFASALIMLASCMHVPFGQANQ
jgi:hypothetical protein